MFGLVTLTGVVVNDSLIMADFINRARDVHADVGRLARQAWGVPTDRRDFETASLALAVREAGVHHFRPILLTSLTTFFGLAPLMWNRSLDASFMVPMAVSLGFGGAVRDADHAGVRADGVHDPRRRRPDDAAGLRRPRAGGGTGAPEERGHVVGGRSCPMPSPAELEPSPRVSFARSSTATRFRRPPASGCRPTR